ncbi:LacI family DNA-binding transcriptional regulator [Pantoea sp. LMR881]|uniref:LacI family DNA-binding transcriptional regulator n=1 Tax=Pantoea sp. LMR881 TaxID=3014336 RepID=UPI0022B01309|nr:LacI family DNA-binding transcriptional regulator [Pantoea sp. LMR881]MCZ4061084.1 LacI family DNA-binding transcriptional regulator [Pantoea sp. LMR881]
MKKLTLEMLAKKAGVGIATVDRVLNERGGVSPETARKVLNVARQIGLKRLLPEDLKHPWQIELFLSSNDSYFFKQLARQFADVASHLGYQRLTLHRTLVPESQPEKLAQLIIKSASLRDGIIVFGHDYPVIHDALHYCQMNNVPVITLATDIPGVDRLCHVGINQQQAGRTAGLLMSKSINRPGDIIMVSGRFDYRAHRQRIEGFRNVVERCAPQSQIREVLAGLDQRDTIRGLLEQALSGSQQIAGIYNTGVGNSEISDVLKKHKLLGHCCYITHELYSVTRKLLEQDMVSFTLDQNAREHAVTATDLMLRYLESGYKADEYKEGNVAFRIVTAENLE